MLGYFSIFLKFRRPQGRADYQCTFCQLSKQVVVVGGGESLIMIMIMMMMMIIIIIIIIITIITGVSIILESQ